MAVFALPPTLRFPDVAATLKGAAAAIDGAANQPLTIDGQALQRFDSSALAVLLECRRQAQARRCALRFTRLPERLLALSTLYGLGALIENAAAAS